MCMVSAVIDYHKTRWPIDKTDEWDWNKIPSSSIESPVQTYPVMPTKAEIEEFYKLLEAAREYDKKTKQPDCEREELKNWFQEFKKLAKKIEEKL